jgi:hypothetical protein
LIAGLNSFFFEWNAVGEAPTAIFLKIIRTQICVPEDLNVGGWVSTSLTKCARLTFFLAENCRGSPDSKFYYRQNMFTRGRGG